MDNLINSSPDETFTQRPFKTFGNVKNDENITKTYNAPGFSLTQKQSSISSIFYNDFINVSEFDQLNIALTVKAKKITNLYYCIELFDSNKNPISTICKNVYEYISDNFRDIILKIPIGSEVSYIKLRFDFQDTVSACNCLNPRIFPG